MAARVSRPDHKIEVMHTTDQQASWSQTCFAPMTVGLSVQTGARNPQASYYRARYYDPSVGRFTREDPIDFSGGIDFYAYSRNNPVLYNDPFGLSPLSSCVWACVKINYGLSRDAGAILGITAPIIPKAV